MFLKRYTSNHPNHPKHPLIFFQAQPKSQPNNIAVKTLVEGGHFTKALQLYSRLWNHGFKPNNFTFPYILKASSQLHHPFMGLLIHNQAIKTGFDSNLFVGNSLILFYGRFGCLEMMHQLFDEIPQRNIVTWTAAISAFVHNGQFNCGIQLFHRMRLSGLKPNSFTMATILPGLSRAEEAKQMHGFMIKCGFESDIFVSTAMIDVYAKCRHIGFARQHFDEMPSRNLVSWNAMILGYTENGNAEKSLQLFVEMQVFDNIQPDSFSIVAALCASSSLASSRVGKEIHGYVYRAGLEQENYVGNALIDMYGKCGNVELAQRVFDEMPDKDVSSWTALITCYGLNGHGARAISTFETMKQTGTVKPNSITFTAVLMTCSHNCLIPEGFEYFKAMSTNFSIDPSMKHYVCMVDMLGRAGHLSKALNFINEMPIQPNSHVWEALLGAASIQGDAEAAEIAVKRLIELEPENSELHVQLSNIHAKGGHWDRVAQIRGRMRSNRLRKSPGLTSIQILR